MKVAVWLEHNITPNVGGGFSYSDKLVRLIDNANFANIDIVFVTKSKVKYDLKKETIYLKSLTNLKPSLRSRIWNRITTNHQKKAIEKANRIRRKKEILNKDYTMQLKEHKVSLIYYLVQNVAHVDGYPFIATNWDIGHLSTYAFPEMMNKGLEKRRHWYNSRIHEALAIFAESNTGKKEMQQYLNINPDKVKVLPIIPGNVIDVGHGEGTNEDDILTQYSLKKQSYFFYPAQFWAHKNHYNLIEAFTNFTRQFPDVSLIFTGSDQGNLDYILEVITSHNLSDKIRYLGFLDLDEIQVLYKNAIAMVMPTFLGPTNMPLLEARQLECPVLCSDFEGHREQLGNGALYFDPANPDAIYERLVTIMDANFRNDLLRSAEDEYKTTAFREDKFLKALEDNLMQVRKIRQCWGNE